MKIQTLSVSNTTTGATTSSPYIINWKARNFGIGLGLTMTASKGMAVDIEHSFDNPWEGSGLTTWHKHEAMTGKTTTDDGNYAYPITAIRIAVTAQTAANGAATLKIVQND